MMDKLIREFYCSATLNCTSIIRYPRMVLNAEIILDLLKAKNPIAVISVSEMISDQPILKNRQNECISLIFKKKIMIELALPEVISKNAEVLICLNLMYLRQLSWFWIEQSIYWSADNL